MVAAVTESRDARAWDIVVFGATGFAGRLVAEYLDRHAPAEVRLAIAGRSGERLAAVAAGLQRPVGVIVAGVDDPQALRAMVVSTRVLVTTVGPYARLGEPVVAACVAAGTDYLDLTGEPGFVARTIARHDEAARASGALVIHCCGFDSVPTDLGVLFTVKRLPTGGPIEIDGYFEGRAGFSGGTVASALGAFAEPRVRFPRPTAPGRMIQRARRGLHWQPALRRWALPLPTIDPLIALRSAAARADYGPEFRYGHYLSLPSLPAVAGAVLGLGAVALMARTRPTRAWIERKFPSGSGPDEAKRKASWFRFVFRGRAGDVEVATEVAGGDPGYDETARMIGESALCVLVDRADLPVGSSRQVGAAAVAGGRGCRRRSPRRCRRRRRRSGAGAVGAAGVGVRVAVVRAVVALPRGR
jgi:short subunit dehydrogenase-like uncharacterized protein